MPVSDNRKNITQPAEWWTAFEAAAKRDGISLSEWLGKAGITNLPAKVRDNLPTRTIGRPKSAAPQTDD